MTKLVLVALLLFGGWLMLRRGSVRGEPRLDETEARAVLGVGRDADAAEIRAAHRRLVSAVHPDKGGSSDLTRRVNAARDVLLKR